MATAIKQPISVRLPIVEGPFVYSFGINGKGVVSQLPNAQIGSSDDVFTSTVARIKLQANNAALSTPLSSFCQVLQKFQPGKYDPTDLVTFSSLNPKPVVVLPENLKPVSRTSIPTIANAFPVTIKQPVSGTHRLPDLCASYLTRAQTDEQNAQNDSTVVDNSLNQALTSILPAQNIPLNTISNAQQVVSACTTAQDLLTTALSSSALATTAANDAAAALSLAQQTLDCASLSAIQQAANGAATAANGASGGLNYIGNILNAALIASLLNQANQAIATMQQNAANAALAAQQQALQTCNVQVNTPTILGIPYGETDLILSEKCTQDFLSILATLNSGGAKGLEGLGGTISGILAKLGVVSASATTVIGIIVALLVVDLSLLQTDITNIDSKHNGVTLHFSAVGWIAGGGLAGVTATLAIEDLCGQGGNAVTCGLWVTAN